jgi:hypothetical protein
MVATSYLFEEYPSHCAIMFRHKRRNRRRRTRIRFSLSILMLIVTAVSMYLGAREWRSQAVLGLCAELKAEGFHFNVPNRIRDKFWQGKPTVGFVRYWGGSYQLVYGSDGIVYDDLTPQQFARLEELGLILRLPENTRY